MSKMIKIVCVLAVVGAVCFGGAFGVSLLMVKPGPKTAAATQPAAPPVDLTQPGGEVALQQRELDELVREVRGRLSACTQREQRLEERERRLEMVQGLLKKEAQELETLRLQLVSPLTQAKEAQARLRSLQVSISQQEKANLKKTAAVYDKMDAAEAAKILEGMVANRQEDDAARLLHFMNERSAAKVLASLGDKALAARLTDRLKRIQEEG